MAIKLKDVVIDTRKTVGTETPKTTGVAPKFEYKDGNKTGTILGYNYDTMFPGAKMEKLPVFIEGPALLEPPNGYYDVAFDGLELYLTWIRGEYRVAARAKGIKVLKDNT